LHTTGVPFRKDPGARDPFTQSVSHIRIIEIENIRRRTWRETVVVASARAGSIWKTPPFAQSFTWIFIDRPEPERSMTRDSLEILTENVTA